MRKAYVTGALAICLCMLLVGCGAKEGASTGIELAQFMTNVNSQLETPLTLPNDTNKKENKLGYYWMILPSEKVYVEVVNYKKSDLVYYFNVVIRPEFKDDPEAWLLFQTYLKAGINASLPADQAGAVIAELNLNSATRAEATAENRQIHVRVGESTYFLNDYSDNENGMILGGFEYDNSLSLTQRQG